MSKKIQTKKKAIRASASKQPRQTERATASAAGGRERRLLAEAHSALAGLCLCAHYDSEHLHWRPDNPCAACQCKRFVAARFRVELAK